MPRTYCNKRKIYTMGTYVTVTQHGPGQQHKVRKVRVEETTGQNLHYLENENQNQNLNHACSSSANRMDSTAWDATSDDISMRTGTASSSSGKRSWQEAKRRRESNWQTQRTKLVETAVSLMAPSHSLCQVCGEMEGNGIIRCHDCGPYRLFCHTCFHKCHVNSRLHCPEIWKSITFVPYNPGGGAWSRSDGHRYETMMEKVFYVFDQNGRHHIVSIEVCQCEDVLITLLRHQLWAASPKQPTVAIHLDLMEWARVLQMEAHVSTKKCVYSLAARCSMNPINLSYISKVSTYKAIIKDSMEEYRHFHEQLKGSAYIGDLAPLDDGTRCPPCHGTLESNRLVCIDGNFGLVHKQSSGSSCGPAKHQGRVFLKQEDVDAFVNEKLQLSTTSRQEQSCSNFQAGSALGSKGKALKVDEKGVIGSACQHEFPLLFCSLRHGERFAYPAFIIKEILKLPQFENACVTVAYDAACQLQSHLKDHYPELPHERLQLAIPVFHAYGHKLLCQVTKSLRVTSNVGLADGETLERIWSYLRLFSPMTKEMSASKRIDLLTDALLHHSRKERQKLGHKLKQRLDRAEKVQAEAEQEISDLAKTFTFNGGTVERWYKEDVHILQQNGRSSAHLSTAEEYAVKLSSFYLDREDAEAAMGVVELSWN